jgi:hypothetical protein
MSDKNVRVPFEKSTPQVTSIRRDDFVVDAFSADEVVDTLDGLDRLTQMYGFDNVALHVADALIHLRARMETEQTTVAEEIEQRLAGLEQKVRDFNAKDSPAHTRP